jgi:capsular polysaccharide transport system permease protein
LAAPIASGEFAKLARTQFRILVSLSIRDMQTRYGKHIASYGWAIYEPFTYVTLLMCVHVLIAPLTPPGMPPLMFVVLGVMPWVTFTHTFRNYRSVKGAKSLLVFGRVTMLDLFVARCVVTLCTLTTAFTFFALFSMFVEGDPLPSNMFGVLFMFFCSWLLGLGFGLCLMGTHRFFPLVERVLIVVPRIGLWTSGVFFVIAQLPQYTWRYMTWNPMLHVNELMREYWFTIYTSPVADPGFVLECILGLFFLGVMLERQARIVPL